MEAKDGIGQGGPSFHSGKSGHSDVVMSGTSRFVSAQTIRTVLIQTALPDELDLIATNGREVADDRRPGTPYVFGPLGIKRAVIMTALRKVTILAGLDSNQRPRV